MRLPVPDCLVVLLALCGSGVVGCQPSRPAGELVGRVTVDGKALDTGVVCALSTDGLGGIASLDEAGAFRFADGLPPGTYRVWLEPPPSLTGGPGPDTSPQSPEGQAIIAHDKAVRSFRSRVPKPFLSQLTTPLTVTVTEGPNELPIDISK